MRKPISNKQRFEIFKRDGFICQYCGSSAQETKLQIDHIQPVANGGSNETGNLITSCHECNSGKAANLIMPEALETEWDFENPPKCDGYQEGFSPFKLFFFAPSTMPSELIKLCSVCIFREFLDNEYMDGYHNARGMGGL